MNPLCNVNHHQIKACITEIKVVADEILSFDECMSKGVKH